MPLCPIHDSCGFYAAVEPSLVKRIKYASAYPYCKGGMHETCAIHSYIKRGRTAPADLLPNGTTADYADAASHAPRTGYLVIEDSPVFAAIAGHAIRDRVPQAEVIECTSFSEAEQHLRSGDLQLVVCGYGIGDGRTAHDVRRMTQAPLVVLTGIPEDEIEAPPDSRVVFKMSGPNALKAAIDAALG